MMPDGSKILINSVFLLFSVAKKVLNLKKYKVDLEGGCSISVEARPIQLMLPKLVEVQQRH